MSVIVKAGNSDLIFLSGHEDREALANIFHDGDRRKELILGDSQSLTRYPVGAYIINDELVAKVESTMKPKRITAVDVAKRKREFLDRDFRDLRKEPYNTGKKVRIEYVIPSFVIRKV